MQKKWFISLALFNVLFVFCVSHGYAVPGNDNFADAIGITGREGATTGNTTDADSEPGEPNHAGVAGGEGVLMRSIWYRWTAPSSNPVTIDTFGSSFDTVLAVYTGEAVDALTEVVSNDDYDETGEAIDFDRSMVMFTPSAGIDYHIAVAGFGGDFGAVVLNWSSQARVSALPAIYLLLLNQDNEEVSPGD